MSTPYDKPRITDPATLAEWRLYEAESARAADQYAAMPTADESALIDAAINDHAARPFTTANLRRVLPAHAQRWLGAYLRMTLFDGLVDVVGHRGNARIYACTGLWSQPLRGVA